MKTRSVTLKTLFCLFWLASIFFAPAFSLSIGFVYAQESSFRKLVNCKEYWAQKDQVPVYEAPSPTSEVLDYLEPGERVCVVGERGDFFILDWKNQDKINGRHIQSSKGVASVAYTKKESVSLVVEQQDDLFERAKTQLDLMRGGLVPEDIYGPFGPLIDLVHPPTKCRAGAEVCKRVDELQQDVEQREENCDSKQNKKCTVK